MSEKGNKARKQEEYAEAMTQAKKVQRHFYISTSI